MPLRAPPCVAAVLLALALLPLPTRAQPTTHSLDDGTAEYNVGWSETGGSIFFANQFTAAPGGELLTSISVAYGTPRPHIGVLPGMPLTLFVFRDAQGRDVPAQPVLLGAFPSAVTNPDTNTFHPVPIAPLPVDGHFFVGVHAANLPQAGRFPVGFDSTAPASRSFGAFFTANRPLDDLPSLTFDPTLDTNDGFIVANRNAFIRATDGQFLIRAESVPVPEPTAGAALVAAAALLVRRRRT